MKHQICKYNFLWLWNVAVNRCLERPRNPCQVPPAPCFLGPAQALLSPGWHLVLSLRLRGWWPLLAVLLPTRLRPDAPSIWGIRGATTASSTPWHSNQQGWHYQVRLRRFSLTNLSSIKPVCTDLIDSDSINIDFTIYWSDGSLSAQSAANVSIFVEVEKIGLSEVSQQMLSKRISRWTMQSEIWERLLQ